MNILIGILIIIFGGIVGAYLDINKKIKAPVIFYNLGFYIGIIATCIMFVLGR